MNSALLLLIALADAAFAGFRAYAGRDARIRRRPAIRRAALRGLTAGVALACVALLCAAGILLAAADPDAAYRDLDAAAGRALWVLVPYAAVVGAALLCYFGGPFRLGTLAVVAGLGPLTMLRPVAVAACVALAGSVSLPAAAVMAVGGVGVLAVEPWVHRRWYPVPV
ncbi:hypothetical protein [Yinghuangia soli]|uniref:Uncharacterized protein n=1 Tax=Yinghuangia soli TaxID=2908204 RepID=A0AA41U3V1_9ACTN|nr:hypothetical protein [Yinghuangia soli]MCF2533113.1 hypothetical protein [Yinghuangia soli]